MGDFQLVSSPFINNILRIVDTKIITEVKPHIKRRVFAYEGDTKALLTAELKRLEQEGVGIFCCIIHNGFREVTAKFGEVLNYRHGCERWYKPRGKKAQLLSAEELPTSTRANGCGAYVSHQFFEIKSVKICVQRVMPVHTGHDVNDASQLVKSRICPELLQLIDDWFSQQLKKNDVRQRCLDWAKAGGHFDTNDRRYYPSTVDLKTLYIKYKRNCERAQRPEIHVKRKRAAAGAPRKRVGIGQNKKVAYETHQEREIDDDETTDTKPVIRVISREQLEHQKNFVVNQKQEDNENEHVVLYQQQSNVSSSLPVLIVLQTEWQREQMMQYGNDIVFLLATYSDSNVLYVLVVRNEAGDAVPVCYAFTSEETEENLSKIFEALYSNLEKCDFFWNPVAIMVDKNMTIINVLKRMFDEQVPIFVCWFHVLRAVLHWTMKEESGLRHNNLVRAEMFRFISSVKSCPMESEFDNFWAADVGKFPKNVTTYLNENWNVCSNLWSNFGRKSVLNEEENRDMERFFDHIKYQLLNCLANRQLDGVVTLLMDDEISEYQTFDSFIQAAYQKYKEDASLQLACVNANEMLESGWDKKIRWLTDCQLIAVPSHTFPGISYYVNLVDMWCTCRQNGRALKCEHMLVVEICAENETFTCPSGDELRDNEAQTLYMKNQYDIIDHFMLIVNDVNGYSSVIDMETKNCNCVASSFGLECVCFKILQKWLENNQDYFASVTTTDEDDNKKYSRPSIAAINAAERRMEAQQLCEEILNKLINSDWDPSTKIMNDLRRLHSSIVDVDVPRNKRVKI